MFCLLLFLFWLVGLDWLVLVSLLSNRGSNNRDGFWDDFLLFVSVCCFPFLLCYCWYLEAASAAAAGAAGHVGGVCSVASFLFLPFFF